ncbi:MAPEG family protein [Aspergillus foveolatus]|uniref:MAPEG family protein n=1 Tax=Aspergillus foveolatus TaxID=210207 RepID=UPI003CCCE034
MVEISIPANYGYAIAVSLGAIPVLGFIHGVLVGSFRKAAGVPYPHAYASIEQCKINPKAYKFNCAQRAHGNFLENAPQTMLSILMAGVKYPQAAAGLGAAWVVFRTLYMLGYIYSDKPNGTGRYNGLLYLFAQAGLWGLSAFGVARDLM